MNQPNSPISPPPPPTTTATTTARKSSAAPPPPKLPTPQDFLTHYESQGMSTSEAAIKAIDDLQSMLLRLATATKANKKTNFAADTSRKLDSVNARLVVVERKIDSKPGFASSFALGFGAATAFSSVASVWPHVAGGVVGVWNFVLF